MADTRSGTDDSRIGSALIIAILGLLIPAILVRIPRHGERDFHGMVNTDSADPVSL